MNKQKILTKADHLLRESFPEHAGKTSICLHKAWSVGQALREADVRAVVQAGSCFWPRVVSPTEEDIHRFGYQWEMNQVTLDRISRGLLPEMHVWVAIPDRNEIVDSSSGDFPNQCRKLLNLDWPGVKPPTCFWQEAAADDWPEGVAYTPDIQAINVALAYLNGFAGGIVVFAKAV